VVTRDLSRLGAAWIVGEPPALFRGAAPSRSVSDVLSGSDHRSRLIDHEPRVFDREPRVFDHERQFFDEGPHPLDEEPRVRDDAEHLRVVEVQVFEELPD
jgi:hypothetical protein